MKSGFVSIVGKPNVGKSTLLNKLVGSKISIISPRPATTKIKILGKFQSDEGQIIFIDTPGFERGKNQLGEIMLKTILASLEESDIVFFMISAKGWKEKDEKILETLKRFDKKLILGINKIDILPDKGFLLPLIDESSKKADFLEIVPFSALKNKNVNAVVKAIMKHLLPGEKIFPDDTVTNLSLQYEIAEVIREKVLERTYQEVPQSIAVEVEEMKKGDKNREIMVIKASIIVDRDNLKSIIIGKNGLKLKSIGKAAREEISFMLEKEVFLELWVKVIKKWRERPDVFRRFGYGNF
jgi:GTPase